MRPIRSVMLVQPGADDRYQEVQAGYRRTPPPLGLVILAELARHQFPGVRIRVVDGSYTSMDEIKNALSSGEVDLLGLTSWFTNHNGCLEIARFAKAQQPACRVIFGGPNAGHLATQILRNREYVDAVVAEDGEDAFLALLTGADYHPVPNLFFRDGQTIVSSPHVSRDLNTIPLLRFNYADLREPMQTYDSRRIDYDPERLAPFSISSVRGCIKAAKTERCSYCSIPGKKVRVTEPHQFWKQIEIFQSEYGIEYFFETGDEFCVGNYPQRLLVAKPAHLNPRLRIYTQPTNLTASTLTTLRKLGVVSAFVGIENVSSTILTLAKKPYDTSCVREGIDLMLENGIRPLLGFLFGLPGETSDTASRNIDFALELVRAYGDQIQRLLLTVAVPTVGCEWFESLARDPDVQSDYLRATGLDLAQEDAINYDVLTRISVQRQSQVDWTWLNETVARAQAECASVLGRHKITTFGTPKICPSDILETASIQPQRAGEMVRESAFAKL